MSPSVFVGYIWFSENLRGKKYRGKVKNEKKGRKLKNKFKLNKLFLYASPNPFEW